MSGAAGNRRGGEGHPFDVTPVRVEMGPVAAASTSAVRLRLTLMIDDGSYGSRG
jgi:hypothetical protein